MRQGGQTIYIYTHTGQQMQIYICRIDRKLRTTVASGRRIGQMGVKDAKIFPCKSFCITWILNHVDILPPLKKRWSSLSFWLVKKQIILSSLYVLGVYHVPATLLGISLITKNLSEEGTCELDQTASGKGNMCSTCRGERVEGQTIWGEWPLCVCLQAHVCTSVHHSNFGSLHHWPPSLEMARSAFHQGARKLWSWETTFGFYFLNLFLIGI